MCLVVLWWLMAGVGNQNVYSSLPPVEMASISRIFIGIQPQRFALRLARKARPNGPMSVVCSTFWNTALDQPEYEFSILSSLLGKVLSFLAKCVAW